MISFSAASQNSTPLLMGRPASSHFWCAKFLIASSRSCAFLLDRFATILPVARFAVTGFVFFFAFGLDIFAFAGALLVGFADDAEAFFFVFAFAFFVAVAFVFLVVDLVAFFFGFAGFDFDCLPVLVFFLGILLFRVVSQADPYSGGCFGNCVGPSAASYKGTFSVAVPVVFIVLRRRVALGVLTTTSHTDVVGHGASSSTLTHAILTNALMTLSRPRTTRAVLSKSILSTVSSGV